MTIWHILITAILEPVQTAVIASKYVASLSVNGTKHM